MKDKTKDGRKKCVGWRISATNWIWLVPVIALIGIVLGHATGYTWIYDAATAVVVLTILKTFRLVGDTWYE